MGCLSRRRVGHDHAGRTDLTAGEVDLRFADRDTPTPTRNRREREWDTSGESVSKRPRAGVRERDACTTMAPAHCSPHMRPCRDAPQESRKCIQMSRKPSPSSLSPFLSRGARDVIRLEKRDWPHSITHSNKCPRARWHTASRPTSGKCVEVASMSMCAASRPTEMLSTTARRDPSSWN